MARLYADENFPLPVTRHLRQLEHDVVTVQETGRAGEGLPDSEILLDATRLGRSGFNVEPGRFLRIHAGGTRHAGMILCTFDPDFERQAERIHQAVGLYSDLEGTMIRVSRPQQAPK